MILKTYILHPQINQGNNTSTVRFLEWYSTTKALQSWPPLSQPWPNFFGYTSIFVFISDSLSPHMRGLSQCFS